MDGKYTFERFEKELDDGYQMYYTYVRNRYLLSRTWINLNIIYWRERYIMYYQYPYPYQGYGYQQNNGGYGFVWGIIIVVFIIFLLFWGFGAVNKGCN